MKLYLHYLTAGQQGGIGYPPMIARLIKPYKGKKIYGISDSREKKIPDELNKTSIIGNSSLWKGPYSHERNPQWRSQQWCWGWWHSAPQITWNELTEIIKGEME